MPPRTTWAAKLSRLDPETRTSVRTRLLMVTGLAISPVVVFASVVALQHAYGAAGFTDTAAWIAASILPVLFGIGAVLVISLSTETLILDWMTYLERLAHAYAKGRYGVRPKRFQKAPAEFQSLGEAVWDMAASIQQRDGALRSALDEQSVLLREVHHRVKNNLQIVGSLLSMQAARSADAEVKEALGDALVRIDAMALAQRFMRPTEGEDIVSAPALFEAFATQFQARMGQACRGRRLELHIEAQQIGLDLGARLVLIAAEALLHAYRRPLAGAEAYGLSLSFDDHARLEVTASGDAGAFSGEPKTFATSLIEGYARQIHASIHCTSDEGRAAIVVRAPL